MKLASTTRSLPRSGAAVLLLGLHACGGTSPPTIGEGALEFVEANVVDGQTWTVDGPIELRFTQPIDFGSVHLGTVQITGAAGQQAAGTFAPGTLPSGQLDRSLIRFVPACPDPSNGGAAGFEPGGLQYTISVRGSDSGSAGIVSIDGFALEESFAIGFRTPTSLDPAVLFHDPLPTPAAVVIRGAAGVSVFESRATLVEVGTTLPRLAYFQHQGFGAATLEPEAMQWLPDGLPLNHRVAPENRVAFVIQFDQPIGGSPSNIDKIGVEYLDGTWKQLRGRAELASNCADVGYAVRFRPEGLLPRATGLRIAIEAGLMDRGGQVNPLPQAGLIDVRTTGAGDTAGAPSDAIFEGFFLGGSEPGSIEDTASPLGSPRALWGAGALIPQPDATGESMARSRWVHLGHGKIDPGFPDRPARFLFGGVDGTGAVEQVSGIVTPIAPSLGPIPLTGMETSAVSMNLGQLPDPGGSYLTHPALLTGSRVVFLPGDGSVPGGAGGLNFYGATAAQGALRLAIFGGCFIPGIGSGDCVPLNLFDTFAGPSGLSVRIVPQFFEVYTGFTRDSLPSDASVRILFDGAMEGPEGEPDPATFLSSTSGWTSDVAALSSQPWDFVRFQVLFDLDASGDGWSMADGLPVLNFVKLAYEHAR